MEIALLGPLSVTRDDRPLELGGAQPRLLLALLALDPGRVAGADRLVDGIWGAHLPSEPANALQVVVSRLRRALAPDQVVISRPPGYLLALEPERVDAVCFERLAAAGREAAAAGHAERAAGLLRAALDLWRGDALADFPGVAAARSAATRLDELRLAALEDRIEVDLGLGRQAQVIGELQALVDREPLRERLHAQLMRALYATGRQADALAAYQRAREVLAERAGLDPGPDLRRLEARLLAQDPALPTAPELSVGARQPAPSAGAPWAAQPTAAPSNLRVPLTSFVGREHEIGQVASLLGRGRLVTLVGPGGAGKTRLAVEAMTRLLAAGEVGRDGAWVVELASLRDPALLAGAVLDAVSPRVELARLDGPAGGDDGDGAIGRLLRALRSRHLLLVLDNCEHLVEAAANLVETMLGACPAVRVLATSREALRVPGELRLPVLAMPPAELDDPGELLAFDAGRLFVERARAVVPSLEPGAPEARAIGEICRRLDGLPFGIERADLPPVPAPPVGEPRYRLLETVRAYAGERLAEAGEVDQVARTHAQWCAGEVDQGQTRLRGADQLVWWTRAYAEHAN